MRLLLDTHVFLWYITNDDRLPLLMSDAIRHRENETFLSVVSVWEILVKNQIGKLALPSQADRYVREQRQRHGISSLSLEETDLSRLLELPSHHRDPFDRMLICQAIHHDLFLATVDDVVFRYPVRVVR
jgi:PIN domain nuclease of toxin-antitoxin system